MNVLTGMGDVVAQYIKEHEASQQLWLPADFHDRFACEEPLPEEALVAVVYNMLTEEGLPNFHRLIATHMGERSPWIDWNNLWTAEEDRHGTVLRDFLVRSGLVRMDAVDRMQYDFLRKGFYPAWDRNPYKLVAYTVLQEKATQVSHKNTAGIVGKRNAVLAQVLGSIAREEGRHHAFYLAAFKEVLARDTEDALHALADIIYGFEMPGANIPGFDDYTYVARRAGIFGPREYLKIVTDVIEVLGIDSISPGRAGMARDRILRAPMILERQAARMERAQTREVQFSFLRTSVTV